MPSSSPRFQIGLTRKPPKYTSHKSGQARVWYNGKTHYLGKFGTPESLQRYAEFIATLPDRTDSKAPEIHQSQERSSSRLVQRQNPLSRQVRHARITPALCRVHRHASRSD